MAIMVGLTAFAAGTGEQSLGMTSLVVLAKGAALFGTIALMMRFVLPALVQRLASSRELLLLFAIAWAVALAAIGDALGFSKEIGAFAAGVSLASTGYRDVIGSRLTTLRDFLLLFFFIDLGAQLELDMMGQQIWPATVLSVFVLIGNPLIVMAIMGAMGYRKRTGFLSGLTVAQISEFSLLFGALGVSLGHITSDTLGLITLVGIVTIGLSTYMILYSHPLYALLAPLLGIFERRIATSEESLAGSAATNDALPEVLILGLGRFGLILAAALETRGVNVVGVDFDPSTVRRLQEQGVPAIYGDAEDPDLVTMLPLSKVKVVVSTIPSNEVNALLLRGLNESDYAGRIALTSYDAMVTPVVARSAVDVLLEPFRDAGQMATERVVELMRRA